ncbi:O-antigen/teichoic acid export membrane protein [Pelomonas saccharophila]|uniref:O-antigen/teichoic acid export membrane protein n=1 Tax=Roseateles saccharophilus TaxID=304 RepID=A0ABU1YSL3_ROSSA|nr:oligosaccharide flippase family protein [Roseateles saccharophilus]MDR7271842.1 O-antigen/teichoic acid export membrane protein [Roseateles saccharophilus]
MIVLVSGTALAHGLSALALPVLSRLYTPTDFGLLAVFSGALSIVAAAACLRYDLAVPLPESEDDAMHLLALSLACACGIAAVLAVAVALAGHQMADLLGQPALAPFLWLLPVGVLAAGSYAALQAWHIRRRNFGRLSRTRVAQSVSSVAVQIGLGSLSAGPVGLLLGYVMNAGVACLALGGDLLHALPRLAPARMRVLAREYRRFPKYSTLEALANSAAIQLPIILIAGIAAPSEAGYLSMAMFAMQVPMALVGTAISQVYLSRAAEEHRAGRLGPFTADMLRGLIRAGIGPLIAAGILAPALFGLILGARWERAGLLVSWMVPWFALQFLASPTSMALHVTGHQRRAFALQLASLLLRVGVVLLAAQLIPSAVAEAYAVSGAAMYFIYLLAVMASAGVSARGLLRGSQRSALVTTAWAMAALAGLWGIQHMGGLA